MTFDKMRTVEMKEKMAEEIKKKAIGGKLTCSTARMIAEQLGVSYKDVGEAADNLHVKITNCQLGCF
jgi:LAO/AO transport system kinase